MKKVIIVGSEAINQFDIKFRESKDIDVWTNDSNFTLVSDKNLDKKIIPDEILDLVPSEGVYATPDAVYTIKCSHLGWDNPMWNKHKSDIISLKAQGCELIPDLFRALVSYWKVELGKKDFLSLNKDKGEFFNDFVEYRYDHDWLHTQVSHPNPPMYTKCLKDGEDVLISKEKFDMLPFEDQVRMFREEISVIALERWVTNPKLNISWFKGYGMSLKKTITNLTKGWATEFIVLNLEYFIKPDYTYFKHFLEEVYKGD